MSKQPLAPRIIGSRQRGAVAIWIAVSLVALISATFLAIDTGQLYYAQKQLEKSATDGGDRGRADCQRLRCR